MRPSPDPRAGWALLLLAASVVLLASIEVGRIVGYRILAKAVEQTPVLPTVRYTPRPLPSPTQLRVRAWRGREIVRIAPDPSFPTPRVTAPPQPRAGATPERTSLPEPTPSASPTSSASESGGAGGDPVGPGSDGLPTPYAGTGTGP